MCCGSQGKSSLLSFLHFDFILTLFRFCFNFGSSSFLGSSLFLGVSWFLRSSLGSSPFWGCPLFGVVFTFWFISIFGVIFIFWVVCWGRLIALTLSWDQFDWHRPTDQETEVKMVHGQTITINVAKQNQTGSNGAKQGQVGPKGVLHSLSLIPYILSLIP